MNTEKTFTMDVITGLLAIGMLLSACKFMYSQSFARGSSNDYQKMQTVMSFVQRR